MEYSTNCSRLNNYDTGFLEIRVMDNRNMPIPNSLISISKISYTGIYNESAEGIILGEFYTDNNGTIQIGLPVLNELLGMNDFYSARISIEGYYDVYIYYIQIYPNINTTYDVYLKPKSKDADRFMLIFQPKRRSVHNH